MLSEAQAYYQALDVPRVCSSWSCTDKVALGQEVLVLVVENPIVFVLPWKELKDRNLSKFME